MSNPEYKEYPPNHIARRSGCKVGWRTYATRKEANACAKAAKWNADIQEQSCATDTIGHAQCTINHLCYEAHDNKKKKGLIEMQIGPFHSDEQKGDQDNFKRKNGKAYVPQLEPFHIVRFVLILWSKENRRMSLSKY